MNNKVLVRFKLASLSALRKAYFYLPFVKYKLRYLKIDSKELELESWRIVSVGIDKEKINTFLVHMYHGQKILWLGKVRIAYSC